VTARIGQPVSIAGAAQAASGHLVRKVDDSSAITTSRFANLITRLGEKPGNAPERKRCVRARVMQAVLMLQQVVIELTKRRVRLGTPHHYVQSLIAVQTIDSGYDQVHRVRKQGGG
jgi:hypothetical protein